MSRPSRPQLTHLLAILTLAVLATVAVAATEAPEITGTQPAVIRIIPPPTGVAAGPSRIETLHISEQIVRLVFLLDGEQVARRNHPPWEVKIPFASPAREQTLTVVAYGKDDRRLGEDSLLVNRVDPPLAIQITEVDKSAGSVHVSAQPSVPRLARIAAVRFFLNRELIATVTHAPFETRFDLPATECPEDLVRVELELADGRKIEDVEVLAAPGLSDEVSVNLVQLQVLATLKSGRPVTDLEAEDFAVRQRGEEQRIDRLYRAEDISLLLGLVIDTSGSMTPIWGRAREAARQFLAHTITERDRAFLVTFDSGLSLVHAATGDPTQLRKALETIEPNPQGMTALYDSVLFSILQFHQEPGRRALVVLTDGYDSSSRARPRRAVEFGRKLGVPVYVIALTQPNQGGGLGTGAGINDQLQVLKLLTQPTGGRLLRVGSVAGLAAAFTQINNELRHQYVLTYYTSEPPTGAGRREVEVTVKGRKGVEVRTILALDQVQ